MTAAVLGKELSCGRGVEKRHLRRSDAPGLYTAGGDPRCFTASLDGTRSRCPVAVVAKLEPHLVVLWIVHHGLENVVLI